mmetsp:Transcript_1264/g.4051  ORF Transcript_1264/g.4051 Transcript_1264/m.4051 type:complete len:200 (+) Transcript_1264:389-988(+)
MTALSMELDSTMMTPRRAKRPETKLRARAFSGLRLPCCGEVSTIKSEISWATSCAMLAPATVHPNALPQDRNAAPMNTPSQRLCNASPNRTPMTTRTRATLESPPSAEGGTLTLKALGASGGAERGSSCKLVSGREGQVLVMTEATKSNAKQMAKPLRTHAPHCQTVSVSLTVLAAMRCVASKRRSRNAAERRAPAANA